MVALVFLLVAGSVFFFTLVVASVLHRAYEKYQERYVTQDMQSFTEVLLFVDARSLFILSFRLRGAPADQRRGRGDGVDVLPVHHGGCLHHAHPPGPALPGQADEDLQHPAGRRPPGPGQRLQGRPHLPPGHGARLPRGRQPPRPGVRPLRQGDEARRAPRGGPGDHGPRVETDDLALVVTAINMARQLGGDMAEMLETLSATIRERFRIEGKIPPSPPKASSRAGHRGDAAPARGGAQLHAPRPDAADAQQRLRRGPGGDHQRTPRGLGIFIIRKIVNINV